MEHSRAESALPYDGKLRGQHHQAAHFRSWPTPPVCEDWSFAADDGNVAPKVLQLIIKSFKEFLSGHDYELLVVAGYSKRRRLAFLSPPQYSTVK